MAKIEGCHVTITEVEGISTLTVRDEAEAKQLAQFVGTKADVIKKAEAWAKLKGRGFEAAKPKPPAAPDSKPAGKGGKGAKKGKGEDEAGGDAAPPSGDEESGESEE